ncbi:MAG: hypothetical protein COA34_007355 [Methylophaga sp.]|uniref:hypothetical protein n=1 Tax=Methylophaga sp. TaxID=2024840 RepID=UPI000C0E8D02|nr:hypothetical protein [Methylophaga sp.]MBL1457673.1 hypothetical protein [Methylophaga sp.]
MNVIAEYRSVADMSHCIALNLWRIPETIDCVVAVPQAGGLPASFLGLQISRPVVDLDWFLEAEKADYVHVLVVDDICRTGETISAARESIAIKFPQLRLTTLALYCHNNAKDYVDIVFEYTDSELLLEWSLFRSPIMSKACLDMDGILCGDATIEQDDDGVNYKDFLVNTSRHTVPRGCIHRIVTSRLEKYRAETEAWLARQGIEYNSLTMLDLPSEEVRNRTSPQGKFKAEVYRSDPDAILFVESETWQARQIAHLVPGKAVFDYKTRTIFDNNDLNEPSLKHQVLKRLRSRGRQLVKRIGLNT